MLFPFLSQVMVVSAFVNPELAIVEFKNASRHGFGKVAVVADHHHGAIKLTDGFEENLSRLTL